MQVVIWIALLIGCGPESSEQKTIPIEHRLWDSLLSQHVDDRGLVDYDGFSEDREKLDKYLSLLCQNHPSGQWRRSERLAYWINAYNAFTIQLILDHYPVESIKDIRRGIPFINSVWDIKFIEIEGNRYDLNRIEHRILRRQFDEPRIHFAINCASMSCPALASGAYQPDRLEEQLDLATRHFLGDTSRNIISEGEVQISRIFSWFAKDFRSKGHGLIDFLNKYSEVEIRDDAEISFLDYDWSLNDQHMH